MLKSFCSVKIQGEGVGHGLGSIPDREMFKDREQKEPTAGDAVSTQLCWGTGSKQVGGPQPIAQSPHPSSILGPRASQWGLCEQLRKQPGTPLPGSPQKLPDT